MLNKKGLKCIISTTLIMSLVLTTVGCSKSSSPTSGNDGKLNGTIKIGLTADITGPMPLNGEKMKQGVQMAVDEINANGGFGGKKGVLVVEDDQDTANIAVNAFNKLMGENPTAIIGPAVSPAVIAVDQIVKKASIPVLTGATSPKLLDLKNPNIFRVRLADSAQGKLAAKFAIEKLGAKKIGMFYDNDAFGTGAKTVVEAYLKSINVPFLAEGHNAGDKDMTSQIMKMKNAGIDALIVWAHDQELAVIARQKKELNLNVPFIGCPGFSTTSVQNLIDKSVSEGSYTITDFVASDPNPKIQEFVKNFEAKYKITPELNAAAYYGAVYILADAIKRAGSTDPQKIEEALMKTKDLAGVMATYTANANGEMVHETNIAQIKDKVPVIVERVKE